MVDVEFLRKLGEKLALKGQKYRGKESEASDVDFLDCLILSSSSRSIATSAVLLAGGPRPLKHRSPQSTGRPPLEGQRPSFGLSKDGPRKEIGSYSDRIRPSADRRDLRPLESPRATSGDRDAARESNFGHSSRKLAKDLLAVPIAPKRPIQFASSSSAAQGAPVLDTKRQSSIYPTPFTAPLYPSPSSGALQPITKYPFNSYSLNQSLKDGLVSYFNGQLPHPTAIQALSLQHLLGSALQPLNKRPGQDQEQKEVLLGSETGSGKTLAYLLPIMHFLKQTDKPPVRASEMTSQTQDVLLPRSIILAPTHELTRQLTLTAKAFSHSIKLRVGGLSSTASGNIKGGLKDVLVGTTRGILKGVERGEIGLAALEWVVVDEADVLFGEAFEEETKSIISSVSQKSESPPSLIFCTATIPPSLSQYVRSAHPNMAKLLSPSLHKLPSKLTPRFVPWSGSGNKLADVAHEIKRVFSDDAVQRRLAGQEGVDEEKGKILVFCNNPSKVRMLQSVLESRSIPSHAFTGEAEDRVRGSNGMLDDFLVQPGSNNQPEPNAGGGTKGPRVLITTSLLSRGLDFSPSLKHVFLLDEPRSILDFMHRAGRTGRAGRVGTVTVFGKGSRDREGRELRVGEGLTRWGGKFGKDLRDVLSKKRGPRTPAPLTA